jgi:hypothetical protein
MVALVVIAVAFSTGADMMGGAIRDAGQALMD